MRIELEFAGNSGVLVTIDGEINAFIRVAEGETLGDRIDEIIIILKAELISEFMLRGML